MTHYLTHPKAIVQQFDRSLNDLTEQLRQWAQEPSEMQN